MIASAEQCREPFRTRRRGPGRHADRDGRHRRRVACPASGHIARTADARGVVLPARRKDARVPGRQGLGHATHRSREPRAAAFRGSAPAGPWHLPGRALDSGRESPQPRTSPARHDGRVGRRRPAHPRDRPGPGSPSLGSRDRSRPDPAHPLRRDRPARSACTMPSCWPSASPTRCRVGRPAAAGEYADWTSPVYRRKRVPLDDLINLCEGVRAAIAGSMAPAERATRTRPSTRPSPSSRWHRRLAGDARKRNAFLQFIYKGG